jgi:hypothetical protein
MNLFIFILILVILFNVFNPKTVEPYFWGRRCLCGRMGCRGRRWCPYAL